MAVSVWLARLDNIRTNLESRLASFHIVLLQFYLFPNRFLFPWQEKGCKDRIRINYRSFCCFIINSWRFGHYICLSVSLFCLQTVPLFNQISNSCKAQWGTNGLYKTKLDWSIDHLCLQDQVRTGPGKTQDQAWTLNCESYSHCSWLIQNFFRFLLIFLCWQLLLNAPLIRLLHSTVLWETHNQRHAKV